MIRKSAFITFVAALLLILGGMAGAAPPGQNLTATASGGVSPWMRLVTSQTLYGQPNATLPAPIRVRVTDPSGAVYLDSTSSPVHLPINFRILSTPLGATGQKLIPGDLTSVTVMTDAAGYAAVNLKLGDINGVYRLAITERTRNYTIDWVRALTPGATASLVFRSVDTTTHTADGVDATSVTVRARDYQGNPVTGAQIFLGTNVARDHKAIFPTVEGAGGFYSGWVTSIVAGRPRLYAWDGASNATARSPIGPVFTAAPGAPKNGAGAVAPAAPRALPLTIVWQAHHIKFWKPKGTDVTDLIAGEISGKRAVFGALSPALGGPAIYITYTVNEYDFTKVDKDGDGLLKEFRNPNNPTEEEKNMLRNCVANSENVFIVPGMTDNSYGETLTGGGVVINQGTKAPAGKAPPAQDGKTLAHEDTHYWHLNADNHTEGGMPLGPDNLGAADPSGAALDAGNKGLLSQGQIDNLKLMFPQKKPSMGVWGARLVYPGSVGNQLTLTFTNSTVPSAPFTTLTALSVNASQSSPTLVANLLPVAAPLTPATLAPGLSAAATFTFDVLPTAMVGMGSLIELSVTCATGETYNVTVPLEIVPPPAGTRAWRGY